MVSAPKSVAGRRLIVGCDGTWLNSDSSKTIPSNVTRLCRSLNVGNGTKEQLIFYSRGIGTDGNWYDKWVDGMVAIPDLSEHIRECFGFLVSNYRQDDEIFLFGFSRGAYTARAISSLISDVGLLTARGMECFQDIFEDWRTQNISSTRKTDGPITEGPFEGLSSKPTMPSKEYRAALLQVRPTTDVAYEKADELQRGYTIEDVPIRVVGVFDTVGSLGIPPVLGLHVSHEQLVEYSFVNTRVAPNIQHAFQALALDEHRATFSPTLWQFPNEPDKLQTLRQVWFSGVHCNIGGACYDDEGQSNISLAWMVSRLQETETAGPMLDFDEDYLTWCFTRNVSRCREIYKSRGKGEDKVRKGLLNILDGYRGWAMGRIEETDTGVYRITGHRKMLSKSKGLKDWIEIGDFSRMPGRYEEVNADTGDLVSTGKMLRGTGERIHPSVRYRVENGG
ncbi:MAG: hypothetical protein M1818_007311 [Claussenomyces sp. TS43310]|nr:MAG: hypothetical protein M1818_007311 [Claussenomyces sp. TS43310]